MSPARFAFLDHPHPIAFAHRGGALEAPENTWTSFRRAHDLGYQYLETDVHATADGIVVTMHDEDVGRTTEGSGLIREMTWSELSAIRLTGCDEPVARLDDALAAWPDMRWNIDAKHDSVEGPLIETVHRSGALDRICVTAFDDRRLGRIRRALGPGLCTGMGPVATAALRVASVTPGRAGRALGERLTGYGAVQVPLRQGRVPLTDRRFIDAAHRFGLDVHVWTIDDVPTMEHLLDSGVDGIITDRPTALKAVLERRHAWA